MEVQTSFLVFGIKSTVNISSLGAEIQFNVKFLLVY